MVFCDNTIIDKIGGLLLYPKVVSRTVAGNAGFSDVKTMTVQCWDFRMIHLIFMNKPKHLSNFYLPPDPNSLQSSPDSLLATLQLNNQDYLKQSGLHSVGFEVEGAEGEVIINFFMFRSIHQSIKSCVLS